MNNNIFPTHNVLKKSAFIAEFGVHRRRARGAPWACGKPHSSKNWWQCDDAYYSDITSLIYEIGNEIKIPIEQTRPTRSACVAVRSYRELTNPKERK